MAKKSDRRTFLRAVAATPMLQALHPLDAQETPRDSPQADALAEGIRLRYGAYLAADDMPEIKRGIERMLRNAETLAKVKTTNSDGPDFLFHPAGSLNS